jgi:hypothetical protein
MPYTYTSPLTPDANTIWFPLTSSLRFPIGDGARAGNPGMFSKHGVGFVVKSVAICSPLLRE